MLEDVHLSRDWLWERDACRSSGVLSLGGSAHRLLCCSGPAKGIAVEA